MNITQIQNTYKTLNKSERILFLTDLIKYKYNNILESNSSFYNILIKLNNVEITEIIDAIESVNNNPDKRWLSKEMSALRKELIKHSRKGEIDYDGLKLMRVIKENSNRYIKYMVSNTSSLNESEFAESLYHLLKNNTLFRDLSSLKMIVIQGNKERKTHTLTDYIYFNNKINSDDFINLVKGSLLNNTDADGNIIDITKFVHFTIVVWNLKHKSNQNLFQSLDKNEKAYNK